MTEYIDRILQYCKEKLHEAEVKRNPILITYWKTRIEIREQEAKR